MQSNTLYFPQPWRIDPALLDRQRWLHLAVIAAILFSMLAPLTPPVPLPNPRSSVEPAQQNTASFSNYFAEVALPENEITPVPATWRGYLELIERRDAFTRHFDLGEGKAVAMVSATPQHFADAGGQWQAADARFVATADG